MKMRKIRQKIAAKRSVKKTKFGSLSLHPFSQSASELGNRPVFIKRQRSKTKSIKTTKSGELISPKRWKRKSKKSKRRRKKKGLTESMLGNSFELRHEMVEDRRSHVLSNSVEEALAEGEAWQHRIRAQELQRRSSGEDLGDLSEYEELQLSPLERERDLMARVVAPQLDRVLGYDVGDGPQ